MDLSYSMDLLKIPDLSQAPNLESVILIGCTSLLEITLSSTHGNLDKLVILNLRDCKRLCSLPRSICKLKSLRHLTLSGCSNLKKVPKMPSQIEELYLDGTAIKEFPSSIEHLSRLVKLSFENCSRLEHLPENICEYSSLRHLILTGCSNLKKVPKMPSQIEELYLDGTAIKELSSSIEHLSSLVRLSLKRCSMLENLSNITFELKSLKYFCISDCSNIKMFPNFSYCQMTDLFLGGIAIKELPSSIMHMSSLVRLSLESCSMLESLPEDISKLESLSFLSLSGCSNFRMVPKLPCHIKELDLFRTAIKELSASSIEHLSSLETLDLSSCSRLESLPSSIEHLSSLEALFLCGCSRLESLPNGICKLNFLMTLDLSGCSILDRLPNNLGNLESLTLLNADETAIREIPASIMRFNDLDELSLRKCNVRLPTCSNLSSVTSLDLSDTGITELPNSLWKLSSLKFLDLSGNKIESVPASIINLSHLEKLDVRYCSRLQSLPELPSSLNKLDASYCTSLQSLPELPSSLDDLKASYCTSLQTVSWSSFLSSCRINKSACFFECSKLDKNALKNSVKFMLQHIREKIILSEQTLKRLQMCFPGSEIPECLNFQSNGSFIKLPRGLFNQNVVGMVFYTVLAVQDYALAVEWEWSLKCEDDSYKQVQSGSLKFRTYPKNIQSDHVLLGFENLRSPRFHKISQNSEAIISFNVAHYIEHYKVKKCGVHLFYKDGSMEESQECSNSSSSFISDDVMEEQEEAFNFFEGESSSRGGVHPVYDKEMEGTIEQSLDDDVAEPRGNACSDDDVAKPRGNA